MGKLSSLKTSTEVAGVIQEVDVIGRELTVLVDGAIMVFGAPPACAIFLQGERVKLRLLQPGDAAEVTFVMAATGLEARVIRVDWRFRACGQTTRAPNRHPVASSL